MTSKTESIYWIKKSGSRSKFLLEICWWMTNLTKCRHLSSAMKALRISLITWKPEDTNMLTKHQYSTSTVCSDVKTVPKNDHLINTTTEDRFRDCFVAHDFHLNHVTALHWICSFFFIASCVTKTSVHVQEVKRELLMCQLC